MSKEKLQIINTKKLKMSEAEKQEYMAKWMNNFFIKYVLINDKISRRHKFWWSNEIDNSFYTRENLILLMDYLDAYIDYECRELESGHKIILDAKQDQEFIRKYFGSFQQEIKLKMRELGMKPAHRRRKKTIISTMIEQNQSIQSAYNI